MPTTLARFALSGKHALQEPAVLFSCVPASGAALPRRCWIRWLGVAFGFWPPRMRRGFRWSWFAPGFNGTGNGCLCWCVPLDRDTLCVFSHFRHVVGELHAEKVVHVGAEGLFDAQGHFRRQGGLAVQKVGERGAAYLQNLRCFRHGEAESFDDFGSYQVAWMRRILHGIFGVLGNIILAILRTYRRAIAGHRAVHAGSEPYCPRCDRRRYRVCG